MKDKKGFTLVELLAVIAILAILVIIALPNVMGMFNQAKENSFTTEIKTVYQQAEQKWISDSMFNTGEKVYARCKSQVCTSQLDLSGRTELEYYIKINQAGKVIEYYATNGTYQYSYSGNGLNITDIKNVDQIAGMSDSNKIVITCNSVSGGGASNNASYIYLSKYGRANIGTNVSAIEGEVFNNYQDAINLMGHDFFLRAKIENNIVTESSVGFKYNGNIYYLNGYDASKYNDNKNMLLNIFGSSSCTVTSTTISCIDNNTNINYYVKNNGDVTISVGWYCTVYSDGQAFCFDD